jgi:formylglycine-generating enzyme required for sulfatase activity
MIQIKNNLIISILVIGVVLFSGCTDKDNNQQPDPNIDDSAVESVQNSTFDNTIGMEFVLIPAGNFYMGSPPDEEGRLINEGPVHEVQITEAFYMGKYEVTQEQWIEIMGVTPSMSKEDRLPADSISWNQIQEFIIKLNEQENTNKYRLPSEAEWEYAARAGTTTRYSFGENEMKLDNYAWYHENSQGTTHPVGQKLPNQWGLYDMHGNVWEVVQDGFHDNYNNAPLDGSVWETVNKNFISRGGSWDNDANLLRSSTRHRNDPGDRNFLTGFRIVRDV